MAHHPRLVSLWLSPPTLGYLPLGTARQELPRSSSPKAECSDNNQRRCGLETPVDSVTHLDRQKILHAVSTKDNTALGAFNRAGPRVVDGGQHDRIFPIEDMIESENRIGATKAKPSPKVAEGIPDNDGTRAGG